MVYMGLCNFQNCILIYSNNGTYDYVNMCCELHYFLKTYYVVLLNSANIDRFHELQSSIFTKSYFYEGEGVGRVLKTIELLNFSGLSWRHNKLRVKTCSN